RRLWHAPSGNRVELANSRRERDRVGARRGGKADMTDWVLRMPWAGAQEAEPERLLTREWLVTNGLGGYASGTVVGLASRRYPGVLIAALPAPLGRQVMLNHLSELI